MLIVTVTPLKYLRNALTEKMWNCVNFINTYLFFSADGTSCK